jgi:tetratricopeptide (TPR) repeat protein
VGFAPPAADTALAAPAVDTTAPGGGAPASEHNRRGNQLFSEGRYTEAAEEYRQAVALTPDDPVVWANLAGALNGQEAFGAAEEAARRSVQLDSTDAYGHFVLGIALQRQEKHEQALAQLGEALARHPESADYRAHYANQLRLLNRSAEALEEARRAVSAEPANGFAHNTLGNVLYAMGQYAEAAAEYEEATRLDPYNEVYRGNLENARQAAG